MLYRFEAWTLDLRRGALHTADREVELRPKSFEMLRYLVENAGRLITKDEIIGAVWLQAVVTDDLLARCISDVRAAIADHDHRIIKTVPRRGYLFTANVVRAADVDARTEDAAAVAPNRPAGQQGVDRRSGLHKHERRPEPGISSATASPKTSSPSCRGSPSCFVIARNSSFQYKGKAIDVRQVGRELGVRYVLEGSIRRAGDRVRISAQLVDAVTGAHRWAERYDRKLEDVFAVQDEVARTIVAVLAVHVNKAETERVLAKPPATWQAYEHYLRAADTLVSLPFLVQQR